jgi:hypothetical protein
MEKEFSKNECSYERWADLMNQAYAENDNEK